MLEDTAIGLAELLVNIEEAVEGAELERHIRELVEKVEQTLAEQ
jgi:hypothetical protein